MPQKKKAYLSLLAYDGNVPVQQAGILVTTIAGLLTKGWDLTFNFRCGDSILPRARNAEASNFLLDPDNTDMLTIDADTICDAGGLVRLLEADADIIGGPYRTRNDPLEWPSIRWAHQDVKQDERGFLEVDSIGTGLMRISRKAMQAIWDTVASDEYGDPTCKSGKSRPAFWFRVVNNHLWGEDLTFCHRWRDLGGTIYTIPDLMTHHIGTHTYSARLSDWLAQQPRNMTINDVVGKISQVINHYGKDIAPPQPPPHLFIPDDADVIPFKSPKAEVAA